MASRMTPNAAAQKWAQRMGQAVTAYKAGVEGVTTSPGQLAARAATLWATNVAAAKSKFARNVAAVTLATWQKDAVTKGASRLASGATNAEPKMNAVFTTLFPFIQNTVRSLPARGNLEANINRSADFQRKMANYQKPGA